MIGTQCDCNHTGLKRKDFQKKIRGEHTDLFILRNNTGMEAAITNYGGIVVSIIVPDKNGNYTNVILGHDNIESIIASPESFLSTIIGRYGNRIAKGKFMLDGKEYQLSVNNGPNSLHGGPEGFHRVVWKAAQCDNQTLILKYHSKDGEEGFPGDLDVEVTYKLSDENELIIDYRATTNKKTIVNLTHHGFFNLAGTGKPTPSIENNIVTIHADFYLPIDEVSIPTGEILKTEETPMDFRSPHTIGERINEPFQQLIYGAGYDHCYVLKKKEPEELSFAAKCVDPVSGRKMEVYTTEPGLQIYTGNWLNGFEGAQGATFPARSAICFEAQHFPDSPNKPHFPSCILNPEENYEQTTIYKFGIES